MCLQDKTEAAPCSSRVGNGWSPARPGVAGIASTHCSQKDAPRTKKWLLQHGVWPHWPAWARPVTQHHQPALNTSASRNLLFSICFKAHVPQCGPTPSQSALSTQGDGGTWPPRAKACTRARPQPACPRLQLPRSLRLFGAAAQVTAARSSCGLTTANGLLSLCYVSTACYRQAGTLERGVTLRNTCLKGEIAWNACWNDSKC